jgi:hypothetical protein
MAVVAYSLGRKASLTMIGAGDNAFGTAKHVAPVHARAIK